MPNTYNNKVVLASGEVLIDLTADTVDAAHLLSGYTAHDKSGAPITGSCDYDSDTSDDTAAVSEILAGKTAHARGTQLTGTMPNRGGVTGTIATKAGQYTVPQVFAMPSAVSPGAAAEARLGSAASFSSVTFSRPAGKTEGLAVRAASCSAVRRSPKATRPPPPEP